MRKQREGSRNNVLYWAASRALEQGTADLQPLVEAAVASGLTATEAHRTVQSATRRAQPPAPLRLIRDDSASAQASGVAR